MRHRESGNSRERRTWSGQRSGVVRTRRLAGVDSAAPRHRTVRVFMYDRVTSQGAAVPTALLLAITHQASLEGMWSLQGTNTSFKFSGKPTGSIVKFYGTS